MTEIVTSSQNVTLLGGGALGEGELAQALAHAPRLVAADGGADAALAAGLHPEAVIGDLDSVSDAARAVLPAGVFHRIDEQQSTDFEKCLRAIRAPLILGVGFLGDRADHGLAAMNVLVRVDRPCLLLSPWDVVFHVGSRIGLGLAPGTRLSIFPMRPVTGVSEGLEWPIDGLHLSPDGRIGTSNRVVGPVRLAFDGPGALVMVPRAALGAVLASLARAPG